LHDSLRDIFVGGDIAPTAQGKVIDPDSPPILKLKFENAVAADGKLDAVVGDVVWEINRRVADLMAIRNDRR
jgi:hypothetical protein